MKLRSALFGLIVLSIVGCGQNPPAQSRTPQPKEIIDLGALVTEDLTIQVWGKRYPRERGYDRPNLFEVMPWPPGPINGQNSYYTLFNHGGPHVDAPIHMGFDGGVDDYDVESFAGPLKVFDVSHLPFGRSVNKEVFDDEDVQPGDVVLIYTAYEPPTGDDEYQRVISLTREAAEYLAEIPVRAFATDAWSVDVGPDDRPTEPTTDLAVLIPVHDAFLSRGIPAFEQLFSVHALLDKNNMFFVGATSEHPRW